VSSTGHQAKLHRGRGERREDSAGTRPGRKPGSGGDPTPRPRFTLATSAAPADRREGRWTWGQGRGREEEHPVGGEDSEMPIRPSGGRGVFVKIIESHIYINPSNSDYVS